ncbi:MAG: hypothetical protein K2M79_05885 [Muribaculaceae bacterium]|nr:hypothetical protein [Muribaculaceae bacterium]
MRCVIFFVIALMCGTVASSGRGTLTAADLLEKFDTTPVQMPEGIWSFSPGNSVVSITESDREGVYTIRALSVWDAAVSPGTVLGEVIAGGTAARYDAWMYSDPLNHVRGKKYFILNVSGDGHFTIEPYRKNARFALWRWIPYIFRVSVLGGKTRPANIDGLHRLYPYAAPQFMNL